MTPSSASLPVIASPTTPATAAVCPYLLASDGRWRSSAPAREHRCTAVAPASLVTMDKQRRMCLAAEHGGCATFLAAGGLSLDEEDQRRDVRRIVTRPVPRTAPLVLDHGRVPMPLGPIRERGIAQGALLALMGAAFAVIVVARLSGTAPDGRVLAGLDVPAGSSTPRAGATVTAAPVVAPGATSHPTGAPTDVPTAEPTTAPTPSPRPSTYTVRRGDTMSGIAAAFGTTVRALADLNEIEDPSRLRIGQRLELPPAE